MLLPGIAAGMLMIGAQATVDAPPPEQSPVVDAASAAAVPSAPAAVPSTNDPEQPDGIVVTGAVQAPPGDPFENLNAKSFEAVQSVDKAVVEPVAKAYNKGVPKPVRKGFRNFFANLQQPVVFAAYMLQLKPGKAMETVGRFTINTTLGVAGLFDVAKRKPFFLPHRPNGLANVLGYYGVGPGPYMYLPIVGPTTLRDIIGDTVDKMAVPFLMGKPFTEPAYVIPTTILNQLGERAAFDDTVQQIRKEEDPYAAYRELYLKQRKAEIEALHGRTSNDVVPVYGRRMGEGEAVPQ